MPMITMGGWGSGREISQEFTPKRKPEWLEGGLVEDVCLSSSKRQCFHPNSEISQALDIAMDTEDDPPMNRLHESPAGDRVFVYPNHVAGHPAVNTRQNSDAINCNTLPHPGMCPSGDGLSTPVVPPNTRGDQNLMDVCGETYSTFTPDHLSTSPRAAPLQLPPTYSPTVRSYCRTPWDRSFCMRSYFSDYY